MRSTDEQDRGCRRGPDGFGHRPGGALAGHDVVLRDVSDEALERGRRRIASSLGRFVAKERVSADDSAAAIDRIATTTDLSAMSDVDLVVEAVFEEIAVKHEVFRALDGICRPDAVLATNTSALPDHVDRRGHLPARSCRGHPLLLTGADDATLRARPRSRDQRRNPCRRTGIRGEHRQDLRSRRTRHRRVRHHAADHGAGTGGRTSRRVRRRHGGGRRRGLPTRLRSRHGSARDDRPDRARRDPARRRERLDGHPATRSSRRPSHCAGWCRRDSSVARAARASTRTPDRVSARC